MKFPVDGLLTKIYMMGEYMNKTIKCMGDEAEWLDDGADYIQYEDDGEEL